MNLPVKQLKYYGSLLGKMLSELKESDNLKNIRDQLKELALTDMEYSKFQKRCEANYNLNQLDPVRQRPVYFCTIEKLIFFFVTSGHS